MFGETTVERPLTPTDAREVGYYWLAAGAVVAVLVGLYLGNRDVPTTAAVVTMASAFYEFALFGGAVLVKERGI